MGELEDSIRRQNEEKDREWHYGDPVTIGDGAASGVYAGSAKVMGHVRVRISETTQPDLFRVGEEYNIPTDQAHRV